MKQGMIWIAAAIAVITGVASAGAQSVAKVKEIEGSLSLMRVGSQEWREAKPNMPLKVGDQLYTREESFGVIEYANGTVLRMDEKTKIVITAANDKGTKTANNVGDVWVNMRKLVTKGKEFELSSPTATAAIRGTVFQMSCGQDSSTDVAVYTGKVAVGPSDQLKQNLQQEKKSKQMEEPTEVPGPEEIPGPFEVSLEEWHTIVANQKITVHKDGKFAQEPFTTEVAEKDAFVKKNLELDKKLEGDGKKE
jgi:hypothetical protein